MNGASYGQARTQASRAQYLGYPGYVDLPDPPENLDFLDLFTPDEQEEIARRFRVGISTTIGDSRRRAERERAVTAARLIEDSNRRQARVMADAARRSRRDRRPQ